MTLRARASLDGTWRFWPDKRGALATEPVFVSEATRTSVLGTPRDITVPGPWQAQFDDLRLWAGVAWYERAVTIPASWGDRAVRACFGAVDYACDVWVNGRRAGAHEGGYLPFELDVTSLVRAGEPNTVTLRVVDPGPGDAERGRFPFAEIPHGKQSWYGPIGGIWQSAFLEATGDLFVARALVHADVARSLARVRVELGAPAEGGEVLRYRVVAPDGSDAFTGAGDPLERGDIAQDAVLPVDPPLYWEPAAPRLYRLEIAVTRARDRLDAWADTFGFRTITVEDGRIVLNGVPLYVRGALDQDYYLNTISTPPSDELLRVQLQRAHELGLNLLRCHIKVPDPRYVYGADRAGMLLWCELPNHWELTEDSDRRARETLAGMVRRDFNHPSIIIWTIINESWGIDLVNRPDHRAWLAGTFDWLKQVDPTRLLVDNSACEPNFHVRSDLNDFHFYRAIPDQRAEWSGWTAAWVEDPGRTFAPEAAGAVEGTPLVVSEFGNWGLPDIDGLLDSEGREPWWFDTGDEETEAGHVVAGIQDQLGTGIVRPRGVKQRWSAWALDEVFGTWHGFVRASQEHQFEAMSYEIDDMRRHPELSGYVITEFTDCHWECNGLLDMARAPKRYHDRFREVNGADVLLARPERYRYRAKDEVVVVVDVAHHSDRDLSESTVGWSVPELGLGGRLRHDGGRQGVNAVGRIAFVVPELDLATRVSLELSLFDAGGIEVNRRRCALLMFPATDPEPSPSVRVAARWDERLAAEVAAGGRAVLIATDEGALPADASLTVGRRAGTRWNGEWAQGMTWLRPALTRSSPLLARVDLTWAELTPGHVIHGYAPGAHDDVLAGLYVGWVHATAATVACFRHGAGAGIVTTFPLLADDPLAAWMLARLTEIAGARQFGPATKL